MNNIFSIVQPTLIPTVYGSIGTGSISSPTYPPVKDELLVWLKGNSDDTEKLDSWKKPDAEDWSMSQSNCITLNGADEYGTLDTAITLSGDFEISGEIDIESAGTQIVIGGAESYVRYYVGAYWRVKLNTTGGYSNFINITNTSGIVSIIRDGANVTLSVGNQSQTIVMDAGNVTFSSVGYYNNNDYVNGKIYNLHLKDSTQDTYFRIAEGNDSEFSWDDTGTNFITWTGVLADMWAGSQDTYHGNAVDGWWEKTADATMYPYAVAGFSEYHRGGTWNNCETAYGPEEFPVGDFNGTDDAIALSTPSILSGDCSVGFTFVPEDMGSKRPIWGGASSTEGLLWLHEDGPYFQLYINGNAVTYGSITFTSGEYYVCTWSRVGNQGTLTVNGVSQVLTVDTGDITIRNIGNYTSTYFDGILRDVDINGTLIPINEGSGTDIHDSASNSVGTLSGTGDFWAGKPMVAQSIIDMEAAAVAPYFTDGGTNAISKTQQEWISDGVINNNKQYYFGDKGMTLYETIRTTGEDTEIKAYQGI